MPAPSLVNLCTNACIRNIRNLTDVGDLEYWKIRHVLAKVPTAEQLHQIEQASPQIREEDAELWKAFIARDISNWQHKNYVPKNPKKWYQVYKKYKQEQQEEISRDEDRLREAMASIQKERAANVSKVVSGTALPKLPKDPRMLANDGGVPISLKKKAATATPKSNLNFTSGSKTKMSDGRSVMKRAMREAREMSARNKLSKPFDMLRRSQVLKAPQHMIDQYRKEEPSPEQPRIYAPRRSTTVSLASTRTAGEDRLRAIANATSSPPKAGEKRSRATIVDDSSDDEDAGDAIEDLFQERISESDSASPPPAKKAKLDQPPKMVKPSEYISSLISKPKPSTAKAGEKQPATQSIQSKPELRVSTSPPALQPLRKGPAGFRSPSPIIKETSAIPAGFRLSTSPPAAAAASSASASRSGSAAPPATGKPVLIRRRAPVDIFNRAGTAAKKVRPRS